MDPIMTIRLSAGVSGRLGHQFNQMHHLDPAAPPVKSPFDLHHAARTVGHQDIRTGRLNVVQLLFQNLG